MIKQTYLLLWEHHDIQYSILIAWAVVVGCNIAHFSIIIIIIIIIEQNNVSLASHTYIINATDHITNLVLDKNKLVLLYTLHYKIHGCIC